MSRRILAIRILAARMVEGAELAKGWLLSLEDDQPSPPELDKLIAQLEELDSMIKGWRLMTDQEWDLSHPVKGQVM